MKILNDFTISFPGLVVGIGNFDGVHRGHRKIIEAIKDQAGPRGVSGIITFREHTRLPREDLPRRLLTTIPQRLEYLQTTGVDVCWIVDFSDEFAAQQPREFIRDTLVGRLGIEGICIGEGFRFGAHRRGTVDLMREMGRELDYRVSEIPIMHIGDREVRSSIIRNLIRLGDLGEANNLLGHDYCLTGEVVTGYGRGKTLGYPTANFYPEQLVPGAGVYLGLIDAGEGDKPGMLYIGTRPTFNFSGDSEVIAEAHIFDWSGRLEGKRIKVCLNKKLRKDITFNNAQELSLQIGKDEEEARRYFINPSYE